MTTAAVGAGIGLAALGVLLALIGGSAFAACSSATPPSGSGSGIGGSSAPAMDCGGFAILAGVGGILLVIGIIVAIAASRSYTFVAPPVDPAIPPPIFSPAVVRPGVDPGSLMLRCPYCGTLAGPGTARCPSCGAPL